MQRQRSRDTAPEFVIRRALHRAGLRYRVHTRPLPSLRRTADVVFTRAKVAVFVDGCFWHGCERCYGQRAYRTNSWYWPAKIQANRIRDLDTTQRLESEGWIVVRLWEHEPVEEATVRVIDAYTSRV